MEQQGWVELGNSPVSIADGTALASSAAIGIISPNSTTNPPFVIAANRLFPGAMLRVIASGRYSNTGTPTMNMGIFLGGTGGVALATTGAITGPNTVTNVPWFLEAIIQCRAIGTSGTLFTQGVVHGLAASASGSVLMPASAPAVATVDTTAAKSLDITGTWSASSASNTITLHMLAVEGLNLNLA